MSDAAAAILGLIKPKSNEPLVKRGLRGFDLKVWEIREGTLTIRISAATTKFSLV